VLADLDVLLLYVTIRVEHSMQVLIETWYCM
jgi:hypothetical protein